jgi:hypothetical protein
LATTVLSNRMYRRVRDELGLAYAADVSASSGQSFGGDSFITVSITPRPEHISASVAAALQVLTGFASGAEPITEKEATEVIAPEIPATRSAMQTDSHWVYSLGSYFEMGIPVLPVCAADKLPFLSALSSADLDRELRRQLIAGSSSEMGHAWDDFATPAAGWESDRPLAVFTSIGLSGAKEVEWGEFVKEVEVWCSAHAALDGVAGWVSGKRGSSLATLGLAAALAGLLTCFAKRE